MEKINQYHDYTIKILLSDSLAERTKEVVWMLRNEPSNPESGTAAIKLLNEAAETNLKFYFIEPVKQLKVGSLGVKMLIMGINSILKVISSVGYKLIGKMSPKQLAQVADFVEEHLLDHHPI